MSSPEDRISNRSLLDPHLVLHIWRQQLVRNIFYALIILGGPAAVVGGYNYHIRGNGLTNVLYLGMYIVLLFFIFRRSSPYTLKTSVLLIFFYGLGVINLINFGLDGEGELFLVAFTALSMLLLGRYAGILALVLSVLSMVAPGEAYSHHLFVIPINNIQNSMRVSSWAWTSVSSWARTTGRKYMTPFTGFLSKGDQLRRLIGRSSPRRKDRRPGVY